MKGWSRTGKIKAIVLGLIGLVNLFNPIEGGQDRFQILVPIVTVIFIPLAIRFNQIFLDIEIVKPTWNDQFKLKRPLIVLHTFSYFFIVLGLSTVIGTVIKYQTMSFFGAISIAVGIAMLLGIKVTLKTIKS